MSQTVYHHRFYDSCWFPRRLSSARGRYSRPLPLRNSFLAILILFALTFVLMIPRGFARKGRTCGVDALYQICLHYKLPIPYEQVYQACKPTDEGNKMYDLLLAAQKLRFSATGMRLSYQELFGLELPAIAFVKGDHFVAVLRTDEEKINILDYPHPMRWYTQKEFEKIWKGEILLVSRAGMCRDGMLGGSKG